MIKVTFIYEDEATGEWNLETITGQRLTIPGLEGLPILTIDTPNGAYCIPSMDVMELVAA